MNLNVALILVEQVLLLRQLTPLEQLIFQESWLGHSYNKMAIQSTYSEKYIREVGFLLWNELSKALGEKVTKKNVNLIFEKHAHHLVTRESVVVAQATGQQSQQSQQNLTRSSTVVEIEYPSFPLVPNSPFYIPRPPLEERALAEVCKPGCLVLIKAPWKMGKSSFLIRVIAHAEAQGYKTVQVDFLEADVAIFSSLERVLRWLCANVSRQLNLPANIEEYWDEDLGSKVSCTLYFEQYLLEKIKPGLVLGLNEVNRIFEYPEVAQDFLPMLRFWHEQARQNPTWHKLRSVIVHSTESYIPLSFNQSPFNVGLSIKLPEFTLSQVQDLAHVYGLKWATPEAELRDLQSLMQMVGGHPYLVNIAFYHLHHQDITLEQLLETAPTLSGIYSEHLRTYLSLLQKQPELSAALRAVMEGQGQGSLGQIEIYKLESLGLIGVVNNQVHISCDLYPLYFKQHLFQEGLQKSQPNLQQFNAQNLEQHQQFLLKPSNLDSLTELANRRYFIQYVEMHWQQWINHVSYVSFILCDLDYFRIYNDTQGTFAGDVCLQRVAQTIENCLENQTHLTVRYGGEEFAVLLPGMESNQVLAIAEQLRKAIKALNNAYDSPKMTGLHSPILTASFGVVSFVPNDNITPEMMVKAAAQALYQAKRKGRDRVTLYNL